MILLYNPAFMIPFGDDCPKENGDNSVAIIIGGIVFMIFVIGLIIEISKDKKEND